MSVRKRGETFMADFMVAGTRYRETFDSEAEAEAWELEARAALKRGSAVPKPQNGRSDTGGTLATLGPLYDYTKANHWENNPKITAPQTAIQSANEVVEFFGRNMLVKDIDTDQMRRLIRHIVASGRTYATADRRLAALSKMLRFAVERGVIPRVPSVPLTNDSNSRLRFLTTEEAQRILRLWREWHQPDLHAITVFGLHTGARLGAILGLRWSNFSPNFKTVLFQGGVKKSPPRTLPLSESAKAVILEMKGLYPDSKGPFAHLSKHGHLRTMWDRMQARLGYDDVVFHTLRHTCASWLVQDGMDLKRVQTWLGHKRIETTLIYAHLAPGDLVRCSDALSNRLDAVPSAAEQERLVA